MPTSMSTSAIGTKLHLSPYAESALPVIVTGKWPSCPYLNPWASFLVFSPCSVEKWEGKRAAEGASAEQSSICCFLCCLAWREMPPVEHGNGEDVEEDGDVWNQPSLGKAQENAELQNHRGWKGHRIASSNPLLKQFSYSRLHKKTSTWVLNVSREGDSTTSLGSLFQCSSAAGSSPREWMPSTAQSLSSNPFLPFPVYSLCRYFLVTNWFGLQFILQLLVRKKQLLSGAANGQTPFPFHFLLLRPFLLHKVHVCERRHLSPCANVAGALGILHVFLNRKTKWNSCLPHHWNVEPHCRRNHIIGQIDR